MSGTRRGWLVPVAAAAFVLAMGAWAALQWSLIPTRVDGMIDKVEYSSDTGDRFREVTFADGRTLVVDRQVVVPLGRVKQLEGHVFHKAAWDRTLTEGDRSIALSPSAAFWQVVVALSLVAVASLARRRWRLRWSGPGREAECEQGDAPGG